MIQANELRIGNIMQDAKGRICTVKQLSIDQNDVKIRAIKGCITSLPIGPIPLTEEILLKCGFERMYDSYYSFEGFSIELDEFYTHIYVDWCENNYKDSVRCWEGYGEIHQLQNLYFALTGKELEVNI